MPKISLPPRKEEGPKTTAADKAKERQISNIINKGSSTSKEKAFADDEIKGFTIQMYGRELNQINLLRDQRPKSRSGKKPGISINGWIVEAIQEKIQREKKEYGV